MTEENTKFAQCSKLHLALGLILGIFASPFALVGILFTHDRPSSANNLHNSLKILTFSHPQDQK